MMNNYSLNIWYKKLTQFTSALPLFFDTITALPDATSLTFGDNHFIVDNSYGRIVAR